MINKFEDHPLMKTIAGAEDALKSHNYQRAVDLFTRVIEDPNALQLEKFMLAGCYLNRGMALRRVNRQEAALQDYERAAQLNPRSFKPHLNAALICAQDFGRYQEAIAEFDKAVELNPTNVQALSSRGLTKMLFGDMEGAEADLRAALSFAPNDPDALCNLGNLYTQRGQYEQAADLYKQALEANPRDAEIRFNLALALEHIGSHRAAESVLRKDKKALQMWERKGGHVSLTPFDFSLIFVKACAPIYALMMGGATLFMADSFAGILVGAGVGAVLGVVLGLLLAGYAKSRPAQEWVINPVPDWAIPPMPFAPARTSTVEMKTGVLGSVLGIVFGSIGAWIILMFFPPLSSSACFLGPMFGFAAGGGSVWRAFRKLSV